MREAFYIELERREKVQKMLEEEKKYDDPDFDYEGTHTSGFDSIDFPRRECKPIVRRRSREQVRKMIR